MIDEQSPATDHPRVSLDELPRHSPWPARLLGLEPWSLHPKTRAEILREYEQEKWAPLLARFRAARAEGRGVTPDEVDEWLAPSTAPPIPVALDGELVMMGRRESRRRYLALIASTLARYTPASALVELGVGYGSVLLHLSSLGIARAIGLDLCPSGLTLLRELGAANALTVESGTCDLASAEVTDHAIPDGALVYTSYATSCVPSLGEPFVRRVAALRPRAVVHFEPFYEHADESLLGLLRRRYIELNDYNRTFLALLREEERRGRIELLDERANCFGVNPLFAASVVAWRPR